MISKNFELMVDVKTAPNSNGGVYFHTQFQETGFPKRVSRCRSTTRIRTRSSPAVCIVKDIGADDIKGITKDDEWFTEHIIVQGNTVTISPEWQGSGEVDSDAGVEWWA
jgi:hypothetical protein